MEATTEYMNGLAENLNNSAWFIQICIILGVAFCVYLFQVISFRKLYNRYNKTRRNWDDALINALGVPLSILIWVLAVSFSLQILHQTVLKYPIMNGVQAFRSVAIAILVTWFLLRFIESIKQNLMIVRPSGKVVDITTVHAVCKFLQIAAILTGVLMVMQAFDIKTTGIIAFGGGSALIVGIAAQDLLANFFGGIVVILDKPFKVGDWIRSPDKEIEGTVEYIGWRQTRIRTFNKRPLYVPNSNFTKITIENPSRMLNRQIKKTVGVRYADVNAVAIITAEITEMLRNHPEIDTNAALFVNFVEFSASSLDILVYTFTKTTDWIQYMAIQQDVMLKIAGIIKDNGAQIAFPTRTLDLPEGFMTGK